MGSNPVTSTKNPAGLLLCGVFVCCARIGLPTSCVPLPSALFFKDPRKKAQHFCGERRRGGDGSSEAQRPTNEQSLRRRGSGPRGRVCGFFVCCARIGLPTSCVPLPSALFFKDPRKKAQHFCGERRRGGDGSSEAQRPTNEQSLRRRGSGPRGRVCGVFVCCARLGFPTSCVPLSTLYLCPLRTRSSFDQKSESLQNGDCLLPITML